jgi:hypothetical protein
MASSKYILYIDDLAFRKGTPISLPIQYTLRGASAAASKRCAVLDSTASACQAVFPDRMRYPCPRRWRKRRRLRRFGLRIPFFALIRGYLATAERLHASGDSEGRRDAAPGSATCALEARRSTHDSPPVADGRCKRRFVCAVISVYIPISPATVHAAWVAARNVFRAAPSPI